MSARSLAADQGTSLIEVVVTMVLAGVVCAVVSSSIVTGLHDQTRMSAHEYETSTLRTAMQRVTREIRQSDAVLAVSATSLSVHQSLTSGHRTVTYHVTTSGGQSVLESVSQPLDAADQPVGAATTTMVLPHVVTSAGTPMFATTPCTPAAAYCASQVDVNLFGSVPSTNEVVHLADTVTTRNQP